MLVMLIARLFVINCTNLPIQDIFETTPIITPVEDIVIIQDPVCVFEKFEDYQGPCDKVKFTGEVFSEVSGDYDWDELN